MFFHNVVECVYNVVQYNNTLTCISTTEGHWSPAVLGLGEGLIGCKEKTECNNSL